MARHFDRRDALRFGAASVSLPLLTSITTPDTAVSATTRTAAASTEPPLHGFSLSDVRLERGLFARKRARMLDFARNYDEDRLLLAFRANADLPTHGAVAPEGWESLDGQGNGNLRGHFAGHFMTMLSQAHAGTDEAVFHRKLTTMVAALHECRQALNREPAIRGADGPLDRAVEVRRGACLYFDVPPETVNGLRAMTFAGWIRPATADEWTRIFDFGNDTDTNLFLTPRDSNGVPRFAITRASGGSEERIVGSESLRVGEWSHVALTLSEGAGALYVNGREVGRNAELSLTPAELGSLAHCWLGRSHYDDPVHSGGYADLNLWSSVLTPRQIEQLRHTEAAATTAGSGDRFSYPCRERGGTVLHDRSGAHRHATYARTWGKPSHSGFLAAYPETQFIRLESLTSSSYPVVWAPYYTAHKILQGLLDAYETTGDWRALDLASGMCDWMYSRLSELTEADRQRMWSLFSSGEYGGVVEAILRTHEHTRQPHHLRLAECFDLDSFIDACAQNTDVLEGKHANQHIPILTGLVLLYERTGEQRYLRAARNFWGMVVPTRMFGIGGTGEGEFFHRPGRVAQLLSSETAETCCAYNMLKLTRSLFRWEGERDYAEYYERALFNQILGSKRDYDDTEKPLTTYFVDLGPGAIRDFTPKDGTTCCEGTGMESATKYQDSVYFAREDRSALYVNLYLPSTLRWSSGAVTIQQDTSFPYEQHSRLRVTGSARFELHLRVPEWVGSGFAVRINGVRQPVETSEQGYLVLSREWRTGDTVDVELPFRLRAEPTPDDPTVQNLMYGPLNLVALDERSEFLHFTLYDTARLSGDLSPALTELPDKPLHFLLGDVELAPFFEGTKDAYHAYFRRQEPRVVFDSVDSGVPNRGSSDGVTFLDEIWSAAPFESRGEFTSHVARVARRWQQDGVFSESERGNIVAAAGSARFDD
ncbi:Beta-L-arabinofuranosidase, GH127 [Actinopolyspora lacussalsi subsp. righensis]|uniref:Beta-L-arabinofuranosidase, GH127 n=1 Tax=Actinopolyspora righensis TaxID=995060 RepID=A0A1I6X207_9ACTN|nr:beta-L-arabinofuranosidase domain-containing protein [Actinopolyspora righensis]SFT32305.1 Beta-L-arabinofuranosidase, GH127 [Actinopolyspora righensis]